MSDFNPLVHVHERVTVTADLTEPLFVARGTIDIVRVRALFVASIATHATDFAAFSLLNIGAAAAGTAIVAGPNNFDEATNGGVAITADVPVTIAVVDAAKRLTDGEVLAFKWDEATTDVANATVLLDIHYRQIVDPASA